MSETEFHYGKLKKLELKGQSVEDFCKQKCNEEGILEIPSYNDNWIQTLQDKFYEKVFINKDSIYQVIEHEENEDSSYFRRMYQNECGEIVFIAQFYNGGTCLTEELEEGLDELNKQ